VKYEAVMGLVSETVNKDGSGAAGLSGLWLAMDTSTAAMTVALFRDGEVIGDKSIDSERNHSTHLFPAVQEMLADAGVKAVDLSGVAVGHGPGSYTGIRISVTVAKTFAWSLKLPMIGISSLETLAYGAARRSVEMAGSEHQERSWVVPYIDARRGKAYTGLYEMNGRQWRCLEPDGIRPLESWLEKLGELAEQSGISRVRRLILAGDRKGFGSLLEDYEARSSVEVMMDEELLTAVDVGKLAGMYGMERAVANVHGFVPNYTQLSEPEKKFGSGK